MKKLKNNKGITLIALVITIIVMLILVGVSISMAVNGGLFNYAGNAVGETNKAITAENEIGKGGVTVDGKVFTSIESYVKETEKEPDKLAGTWVFKDDMSALKDDFMASESVASYSWDVTYTSNSEQFTKLIVARMGGNPEIWFSNQIIPYTSNAGWRNDDYKTINITTEYNESLHQKLLEFLNTFAKKID